MRVVLVPGFFDENFVYREHAYTAYFRQKNIEYIIITSTETLVQKKEHSVIVDTGKYNIIRKKPYLKFKDFVLFRIGRELSAYNPDIVHLFDAQQGIAVLALLWAVRNGKPVIYDHEAQRIPKRLVAKFRFYLLTWPALWLVTKFAKQIRLVTPAANDLILKINPGAKTKCKLGTLGYIESADSSVEPPFEIPDSSDIISLTGYFDKTKNIKPIIAAFIRMSEKIRTSYLIIVGPIEDEDVRDYLKTNRNIIHYDQLLSQEKLGFVLSRSKISIWSKSTSTIFEALKYDNYVILPLNDQTSHLEAKQIVLLKKFNLFQIQKKFIELLSKPKVSDNSKFNYRVIVDEMIQDYQSFI